MRPHAVIDVVIAREAKQSCFFQKEIVSHPPCVRNDARTQGFQSQSVNLGLFTVRPRVVGDYCTKVYNKILAEDD
jgi:hypothetical protein